jgi:hypothetical protein
MEARGRISRTVGLMGLVCLPMLVALGRATREPPAAHMNPPTLRTTPAESRSTHLAPLDGEWLRTLVDADGRTVGVVAVPLGSREPRPVVVAAHGALSRPDWMCGATRDSVGPWPFIVCPHPAASITTMASWSDGRTMRGVIDRALGSARTLFGARMLRDESVYLGHSQGAMSAAFALAAPGDAEAPFPFGLFFEGVPHDAPGAARLLKAAGMQRALLVSGQAGWGSAHQAFARSLRARAVEARHVHAGGGHFFSPSSVVTIRSMLWWLVRDAPHWRVER